jgi:hypothetical protein
MNSDAVRSRTGLRTLEKAQRRRPVFDVLNMVTNTISADDLSQYYGRSHERK